MLNRELYEVGAIVDENMSAPSFSDLGKNIREVLNTGYKYGQRLVQLNMKNSDKNFELGSNYSMDHSDSTMHGESIAKLKLRDYGVLSEKWDTDGKLNFRFTHSKLLDGLDLSADIIYKPTTDVSTVKCGVNYKNDYVNIGGSISNNLDLKYLNVSAKAVIALKDALIGYKVGYDTALGSLTKSEIGLAYKFPNVGIHFNCSPGFTDDFGLSTVVKVTESFEAAMSAGCVSNNPLLATNRLQGLFNELAGDWVGSFGGRYKINDDTVVRAKINSNLQLSTSLMLPISEGVHVTTAFAIDLEDPLGGGHKIGLTLDINA